MTKELSRAAFFDQQDEGVGVEATGKIHGRHCRMDFDLEKKHATGWLIKSVNPFEEPQKSKQKQASDLKVETLTIRQGTLAMPKAKTTANKPLGSVESSEYKFVSDPFKEGRAELVAEGKEDPLDMVEFYNMQNVFHLPETSRWSYIQQHAKQGDIAIKIDSALTDVEKSNASLNDSLPQSNWPRPSGNL